MASDTLLCMDSEFELVYQRNIKRVYQISRLYLKDRQDAEDAAQAVFLKYLRLNGRFGDEQHEKAWFITVTRNHCRDELKRFWKRKRVDMGDLDAVRNGNDSGDSGLAEALFKLPVKYKDVLYLHYIEGYTVREMAKLLRRNESTLRNHLSAGRNMLKLNLGGYYDE